ncbi:MAG: hypothetical protein ACMUHX_07380 [bacterium]
MSTRSGSATSHSRLTTHYPVHPHIPSPSSGTIDAIQRCALTLGDKHAKNIDKQTPSTHQIVRSTNVPEW